MTYPIKYTHVKNSSDKLLVFFNDAAKVGTLDNTFSSFKILNLIFEDYDILFVKDIKPMHWYITVTNDVYNLINNIVQTNNYCCMYGLTSSSGALCLLNTLYRFSIFKKAVIINGLTTLCDNIVDKYKYTSRSWSNINRKSIKEPFDEDLLTPLNKIPVSMYDKYIYYYCNSSIDTIYYDYVMSIYPAELQCNIFFDIQFDSHSGYVGHLLNSNEFLSNIKTIFDEISSNHNNNVILKISDFHRIIIPTVYNTVFNNYIYFDNQSNIYCIRQNTRGYLGLGLVGRIYLEMLIVKLTEIDKHHNCINYFKVPF